MSRTNMVLTVALLCTTAGIYSCRKESEAIPPVDYITSIKGEYFGQYTRRPRANVKLSIKAERPKSEPCFFCSDTYTQIIDSGWTDSAGKFELKTLTPGDVIELTVWPHNSSTGGDVPNLGSTNFVSIAGAEIIVLRAEISVVNNQKPPLYIRFAYGDIGRIFSDSSFVLYSRTLDTGKIIHNRYYYSDGSVTREKYEAFSIGGYADTITRQFTIDPTTF